MPTLEENLGSAFFIRIERDQKNSRIKIMLFNISLCSKIKQTKQQT